MTAYSNVLVAVDASDESLQVLKMASSVINKELTQVTIVHVAQHPVTIYGKASNHPHINENQIRESLFGCLARNAEKAGLSRDSIRIVFGQPVEAIVSRACEDKADLIVMGSHGRHGIQLLLGACANGVLHHAPCDVLAVRINEDL